MASLKPCKTCGREVSTSARKCPYCGQSNPTFPDFKDMSTGGKVAYAGFMSVYGIFVIIIAIIIFVIILMFC